MEVIFGAQAAEITAHLSAPLQQNNIPILRVGSYNLEPHPPPHPLHPSRTYPVLKLGSCHNNTLSPLPPPAVACYHSSSCKPPPHQTVWTIQAINDNTTTTTLLQSIEKKVSKHLRQDAIPPPPPISPTPPAIP